MNPFGVFHVQEAIQIDRPADIVWPYLIAFEQVPTWEEGVLEVRQLTPGEPAVGTAIKARRAYGRTISTVDGVISALEPGRSATMTIRGGPVLVSHSTYRVEPIDAARCRVVFTVSATMRGPARLLHPILPVIARPGIRRNLARLNRRILAGIATRSDEPTP